MQFRRSALSAFALLVASCGTPGGPPPAVDAGAPDSAPSDYYRPCEAPHAPCETPYDCVDVAGAAEAVCLIPCKTGGNCPSSDTGPCECTEIDLTTGEAAFYCIC